MLARVRRALGGVLFAGVLLASRVARSQPTAEPNAAGEEGASTPGHLEDPRIGERGDAAPPPPTDVVFLQYGVAFTAEVVTSAGALCDNEGVPCVLGSGGGIALRAGWRGAGPLYLGGAYEVSKQDPNKLYRLALLQQARGEGRWYFLTARDLEPYVTAGAGVAGYGDEWSVDTWGLGGFLGGGVEAQITRRTVVGIALSYRAYSLSSFTDTSGAARSGGVAQLIGLELLLEQRDPIFTARDDAAKEHR
jgi:hypothetical protein